MKVDKDTDYPIQYAGWQCQPGKYHDIAMTFIAPEDGWVEISNVNTNREIKSNYNPDNGIDGVFVKILMGEEQLWPESGWGHTIPTVEQPVIYKEIKTGDKIHFRVNKNKNINNDGVNWNPTVKYVDLIYFEKEKYYKSYVCDNTGGEYDDYNIVDIFATVTPSVGGEVVYDSSNPEIIEPMPEKGKFKILSAGEATVSASLVIDNEVVKTAETSVVVLQNNVGGPYEYTWNGGMNQGPVWYYKALVPADAEGSGESDYVDMTTTSRSEKWDYFTFAHTNSYGYIRSDNRVHPGADGSPTFVFKAPKDGLIKIGAKTGLYPQLIDSNSTDGIRYRIAHNEKIIYPTDGSVFKHIPKENLNKQDNYGEIYETVKKGDFIYFTLDKNNSATGDMSAWSPTVTYMPNTFVPNPLGLDDRMSVAPRMPLTDGGMQTDDTLQLAYELGMVDIEASGNGSGTAAAVADAVSINNLGGKLKFDSDGFVDIIFNDSYTGGRTIEELDLMLYSKKGESSQFSIDFYYSTMSDKDNLIELYSAAQIREQTFDSAYPFIRLGGFDEKVSDVHKLRVVINGNLEKKTCIAEIDLNMSDEGEEIAQKRAKKQKPVRIPDTFGENMMIQRDKPVKLWGYGGEEGVLVELICDGKTVNSGMANTVDGKWEINLEALPGGHSVYTLKVTDTKDSTNFATVKNIIVGDIWLASGQSNMAFSMSKIDTYDQDLTEAVNDEIRYFQPVGSFGSMDAWEEAYDGKWLEATGRNISGMSAVAYHFAKELYEQNNKEIPIGIISASRPGTTINAWLSEEFYNNSDYSSNLHTANPYDNATDYTRYEIRSSACYNVMVHPFTKTNIKGVIWYQGEDDGYRPEYYKKMLKNLMSCRRDEFGDENLPFYIVQLPSYGTPLSNARWPEMREAQLQVALTDDNSGIAVTIDLGEYDDIHPTNKRPVGQRLAYTVAANVYGKNIEYSGPMYDRVTVDGDKVVVHFTHIADGLVAQTRNPNYIPGENSEFIVSDDGAINGFEISSNGVDFVAATAKIVGDTVEVTGVDNPVAVRFGWAHYCLPEVNLFNSENMPASPFRVMAFESDNEKPSISLSGDVVTVSGNIKNNEKLLRTPAVIMVSYNSDGKINEIRVENLKTALGENKDYKYELTIPVGGSIKSFVWDSINSMTPLTSCSELE